MNEHKRRVNLQLILLGLSLAAILLLAGGLSNLRFRPGEPLHLYQWFLATRAEENADMDELEPEAFDENAGPDLLSKLGEGMRSSLVFIFWVLLAFSILYAVVSPQFRRELLRMFILVLVIGLLLPQIAERMSDEALPVEAEELPGVLPIADTIFPEPPPFIQQPPGWLLLLANVLLLALFCGGIYWVWRQFRSKSDPQAVVVKNIEQALSSLESGSEFKDVVIACYAKMCRELQHSRGVHRHQAMTPREFEFYLAKAGITSTHIRQLTLLFEGVRYGGVPTDSSTEDEAIHSLQGIIQAYGE